VARQAAGDINKAVLCELDQEFDVLASDDRHSTSALLAGEL